MSDHREVAYNAAVFALCDYDLISLEAQLSAWGFKKGHARKLLAAYYAAPGGIDSQSFDATIFGKSLKATLIANVPRRRSQVTLARQSADGTIKLLLSLNRGGAVESVLMPSHHPDRAAGCVSSQIGCAMGCDFCASTRQGLERNLEAGEIVEQFLALREAASAQGRRLTSLVFMGMGEPMNNLDNVIAAIKRIADPAMGALGWKQITVSTVGIVPGMERLTDAHLNVHLAVSLHAPDDETRAKIVPMNKRWKVADIMAAARRFADRSGRIPTIEYTMLAGVNDSDEQALLLAGLMEGFRAHVNLIPYNWIGPGLSGRTYEKPDEQRMWRFMEILKEHRVVAHFRRTRGDDVNAACGQLRETVSKLTT